MWLEVFRQLGVFTIAVAVIGWLGRTIIVHWLDKDVTNYRSNLQNTHDIEMERFRNDLRIRSIEHEIRFRSIHERQAKVLAGTYSRLYEVHKAVASYVAIFEQPNEPPKEEKLKIVADAYENFRSFFYPRKIFFPKTTGDQAMAVANKFSEIANLFTFGERRERSARPPLPEGDDHWSKTMNMMRDEISPLLEQLERDFQRLLGVDQTGEQDGKKQQEYGEKENQ